MLPNGTKLFDEADRYNHEKANWYVHSAFNGEFPEINQEMSAAISKINLNSLFDFQNAVFEKAINLRAGGRGVLGTYYNSVRLENIADFQDGLWKGESKQLALVNVLRNTNFKLNDGHILYDDIAEIEVDGTVLNSRCLQLHDILLEKSDGSSMQPVGRVILFDKNTHDVYSY